MASSVLTPMFASDRKAAKLLDLKPADFRNLVASGQLPRPRMIGDFERWDMAELSRIISGEAIDGTEIVKW